MMKKIFPLAMIFFTMLNPAFAKPLEPNKCPSMESIKTVPWGKVADPFGELTWVVVKENSNFDTDTEWQFIISGIKAKDEKDALVKAAEILKSTRLKDGPITDKDRSACMYESDDQSLLIITLAPPMPINNLKTYKFPR